MLGNDYTITQPRYEVTTYEVAHQLFVNGRRNPGRRSSRGKLPKPAEDDQDDSNFTRRITTSELLLGIKTMKQNKAAGLDGILCEQLNHLELDIFNTCLSTNNTLDKLESLWRQARIVAMLKRGKDPANSKSFRPIALLSHIYTRYSF